MLARRTQASTDKTVGLPDCRQASPAGGRAHVLKKPERRIALRDRVLQPQITGKNRTSFLPMPLLYASLSEGRRNRQILAVNGVGMRVWHYKPEKRPRLLVELAAITNLWYLVILAMFQCPPERFGLGV